MWFLFYGCASEPIPEAPSLARDLRGRSLSAAAPHIPAQCYLETEGEGGVTHNACASCHTKGRPPHTLDDTALQAVRSLPGAARVNPWTNLRRPAPEVDEAAILAWVREDNHVVDGELRLRQVLRSPPAGWDMDQDGKWQGFIPDAWLRPDPRGFDRAPDGSPTGWRAYRYYPLDPGFAPVGGGFGEAWIRLPPAWRRGPDGATDLELYAVNLAIAEALLTRRDVGIPATDERGLGVDLDRDGVLGPATLVRFAHAPREGVRMSWVGAARGEVTSAGLLPEGTELLHPIRYLDVVDGEVRPAARLRELRYSTKATWLDPGELQSAVSAEDLDRLRNPDRIEPPQGNVEVGAWNGLGWRLQGFIEDEAGHLRPQTWEETAWCAGCHGGVGAAVDSGYSFARKLAGEYGWGVSWTDAPLPDRLRGDGQGELAAWLRVNGAVSPWRTGDPAAYRPEDVRGLLLPTPEQALQMGAIYRRTVAEQSFTRGREPVAGLTEAVFPERFEPDAPTGVTLLPAGWLVSR